MVGMLFHGMPLPGKYILLKGKVGEPGAQLQPCFFKTLCMPVGKLRRPMIPWFIVKFLFEYHKKRIIIEPMGGLLKCGKCISGVFSKSGECFGEQLAFESGYRVKINAEVRDIFESGNVLFNEYSV
jgi:hypothetical protein